MGFLDFIFRRKRKPQSAPAPVVTPPSAPVVVTTPPAVTVSSGVYVFGGWAADGPGEPTLPRRQIPQGWGSLQTNDRKMAITTPGMEPGTYDERDPAVTAQRIEWMKAGGLDFAVYQVEWSHRHTRPDLLAPWVREGNLPSPLLLGHAMKAHAALPPTGVKFCSSNWDVMASSGDVAYWREMRERGWTRDIMLDSWRMYFREIAQYMAHPDWLRIGDRPVSYHGFAHSLEFYTGEYGITPQEILHAGRDVVRQVTGQNPYLVATSTEHAWHPKLKSLGFDCYTEYILHSRNGWPGTVGVYRDRWNEGIRIAESTGIDYIVPVSGGYDAAAWPTADQYTSMPTPAEFTAHAREARAFARLHAKRTRAMLNIYAADENAEGGILQPMADIPGNLHRGREMLDAHRAAL